MTEINIRVPFNYDLVNNNFELFRVGFYTQIFGVEGFLQELTNVCVDEFDLPESHDNTTMLVTIWYKRLSELFEAFNEIVYLTESVFSSSLIVDAYPNLGEDAVLHLTEIRRINDNNILLVFIPDNCDELE